MASFKKHYLYTFLILALGLVLNACSEIEDMETTQGTLRFSISQVSVKTETRATPSELGKPLASKFKLKLQRTGTSKIPYEGNFVESIQVKTGKYDVTATFGEDVIIGRNSPYYYGTTQAIVEENKNTVVNIPCKVGNALISAKFGKDEDERIRFAKHYENFGLLVKIDNYSMEIGMNDTVSSIYFRAGSSPKLYFYGLLKNDNNRRVSIELNSESFPEVFNAADHAIVTLTLPDPESAAIVNIGKVTVEDANMDETIPLSWLPVPSATAAHQYDENGNLVGTNVTFSNSYPGIEWGAIVVNSEGEEMRTIEGLGELQTTFGSSEQWPYLPQGNYTAHFYFTKDGATKTVSSRDFVVGAPELNLSLNPYSSHEKYLEGDLNAANACNGKTIYDATVKLNISETILNNSNYVYSFAYTFDGKTTNINGKNTFTPEGMENVAPREQVYNITATATFDGINLEKTQGIQVTGIPFRSEPPTTKTWKASGNVTDMGSYALLDDTELTYNDLYVPAGIALVMDYRFDTTASYLWNSCTTTLSTQNSQLVKVSASGSLASGESKNTEDSQTINTGSGVITAIKCSSSGGEGTKLHLVGMKYAN